MAGTGCSRALHMTTLSMPGSSSNSSFQHYVYIDSTYALQRAQRPAADPPHAQDLFDALERETFQQARHIFTVGEYVRDNVIAHYGIDPARVTAAGTGRGKIAPFHGPKNFDQAPILFVAKERFVEKGGLLLLEAFRTAHARNPRLRLVMVAPPEFRGPIEGTPGVQFRTALPWSELESLFQQAALFAMPALYEPWGLVYLEALACRCPVLGMRRNAMPELTGNGKFGFLIQEPTAQAVSEGLVDAFSNADRLRRMGEAGQTECLRRYTWERTAERIARVMGLPGAPAQPAFTNHRSKEFTA
ncbi:glycosyltransferase family 4 protein [Paludibaculum fermentans]|uniref:Glycosyltransferase family 4 protein n=1 Tax=Paludibaculum fermentans TaxID=1473598 RepID=A0A7S7NKA7_PALFE|nr:glycosyltransferase family 4 protein [Paludibaculum fermentans]QOY85213.1 glycosyltransferase family 4 protein [Paludibaculum fermentans]